MQKRKGFTTVELVIVIAVIAILAAALIPTFAGLIDNANHSADLQDANKLSNQIKLYALNHSIDNEADLRDAINEAMGDRYYENLKPRTARKGYCYWYDYKNCQIVLGTIEEMVERSKEVSAAAPSDWGVTMATGLGGNKDFAKGNLRTMVIPGYFMMSQDTDAKNPLIRIISALESATAKTYGDLLVELEKLPEEYAGAVKDAITAFVSSTKATPILNGEGLFTTTTNITSVYIPQGVDELRNTTVYLTTVEGGTATTATKTVGDLTVAPDLKLVVPNGTSVASNVLNLGRKNDGGLCYGSHEIHMDIEESQLSEYFFSDVTDAVIVLPNGDRYVQVDTNFEKLSPAGGTEVKDETGTPVASKPYGTLQTFAIGFVANGDAAVGKAYLKDVLQSPDNLFAYDLYISGDHNAAVKLTASTFSGLIDGAAATLPVRNVTFSVNGKSVSNLGLTTEISLKNGDIVTVKARDITYTYTVKVTEVSSLEVSTLNGVENTTGDFELLYSSTGSWDVIFSIGTKNMLMEGEKELIDLDRTVTMTSNKGTGSQFTFDGRTLSLKGTGLTGEIKETLTFECRGKTAEIKVQLFDTALAAFEANKNLSSMPAGTFVIGSLGVTGGKNNLTLEDLFQLTAAGAATTVKSFDLTISGGGVSIPLDEDWRTYDLQSLLNADDLKGQDTSMTFTLKSHGSEKDAASVTVRFIHGVYNISSEDEWVAAPDGKSIAILCPFEIKTAKYKDVLDASGNTTTNTDGCTNRVANGEGLTSINIGKNTFYGNLQTISTPDTFKIHVYAYNYLINTSGGRVQDTIILGPDYGTNVSITGKNGYDMGTYVAAVLAKNATIDNCFLSGFRSPVHANGGTVKITNSTLHLGNYTNIYVDGVTDLTLDTVAIVQYKTANGAVGGGISYKYSCNSGQKLTTTNVTMHNFLSGDEVKSVLNTAVNAIAAELGTSLSLEPSCDEMASLAQITHTASGTPYYHMGITAMWISLKDQGEFTTSGNTINVPNMSDLITIEKNFVVVKARLYILGLNDGAANYADDVCGRSCDCNTGSFIRPSYTHDHHNACTDSNCTGLILSAEQKNVTYHLNAFLGK